MKHYKGYLIDLDGTVYFGKKRIPTAETFVRKLIASEVPLQFVTNNATRTPEEVAAMLNQYYEIPVNPDMIYTSSQALIDYLKVNEKGKRVHVVGEKALKDQLERAGFQLDQTNQADFLVQGLHKSATYESLGQAVQALLNGAKFYVTNTDQLIPTENGLYPSSGAITAFLSFASGLQPLVFGKPHAPIIEGAVKRLCLNKADVLLIGDNYQTDIQAGIQANLDTLLVLTGVTQAQEVKQLDPAPTYVVKDLSEWELD